MIDKEIKKLKEIALNQNSIIEEILIMVNDLKKDVKDICQIVREQNSMISEIMELDIPEVNNIIQKYSKKGVSNASEESQ